MLPRRTEPLIIDDNVGNHGNADNADNHDDCGNDDSYDNWFLLWL